MKEPYSLVNGHPLLVESVVLFVDVLGSKEMADSTQAQGNLERFFDALNAARHDTLEQEPGEPFRVATFTDNIALGWPVSGHDEEPAIGSTLVSAAFYQYELAQRDFFVRGGLTLGKAFFWGRLCIWPRADRGLPLGADRCCPA